MWAFSLQLLIDMFLFLVRNLVALLLAACSVAVHLVHATANLFHFEKIDQLRLLSRLSLDLTAGNMLYFMSAML